MQNSKLMLSTAMAFGAIMSVGAASAADMGALPYAKAWPTTQVDPIIGWAGFYAGINGGGLWARSNVTDLSGYPAPVGAPGAVTSISTRGFLAGGQVGYTWQASCFILGIEADGGYMDLGGNKLLTGTTFGTRVGLKSGAYGDLTGRVGVTYDRALFYAKGGFALIEDASSFSAGGGSFSEVRKHSTNSGYTIGAGVEYKIAPGWSAKLEYLHFSFGNHLNYTVIDGQGRLAPFGQTLQFDTVKAGLNYSWGSPVIARY